MALVAGINKSNVSRLKSTMSMIDEKKMKTWHALEEVMAPVGAFKSYRAAILNRGNEPAVPYMCVS